MLEYLITYPIVLLAGITLILPMGLMFAVSYAHLFFLRSVRKQFPAFWKDSLGNPSMSMARMAFRVPRNVHALMMERLEPSCTSCAYSLRGLPQSGRCPECGTSYDLYPLVVDEAGLMQLCLKFDRLIRRMTIAAWIGIALTAALLVASSCLKR